MSECIQRQHEAISVLTRVFSLLSFGANRHEASKMPVEWGGNLMKIGGETID
jgi:hypothetical protein